MSEENVSLVREVYAAPRFEDALALYSEDIVWDMSDRVFNPRVYHGHDGVRQWMRDLREVWSDWSNEPERFVDAGDRVVVVVRSIAKGHGSGVELSERWAQVVTIRDGRVTHLKHYRDAAEAMAEVGLPEDSGG